MKSIGTVWDIVGVGLGPSNLSLSALINGSTHAVKLKAVFFERQNDFQWHSGMMLSDASMQTSFMKDLVTLIDPSNRYSFLMYLQRIGALYHFLNTDRGKLTRQEFNRYCKWVVEQLPWCNFSEHVVRINHVEHGFKVETNRRAILAKNVVIGTGRMVNIPELFKPYMGEKLFHSSTYSFRRASLDCSDSVCIIGGGQSGAEILLDLLKMEKPPKEIYWLSRRSIFAPLDESPFVNELFSPGYVRFFFNAPESQRDRLLSEQKLASDGISPDTLKDIYKAIYLNKFVQHSRSEVRLIPSSTLDEFLLERQKYRLTYRYSSGAKGALLADYVVLATGYKQSDFEFLKPVDALLVREVSGYCVNDDYSIKSRRPMSNKIYLQNAAKHTHGVADPNLSLLAWRSANIINSIARVSVFDTTTAESFMTWDELALQEGRRSHVQ
ncbi:SidA/IucD/PvdA family monooxygenase [Pseudomonas sp. FP597]|uniref:lysine N(6)-hydroxylase/L-ornithine N(5)-oxygenase family protein n=1 Tax=Pseudomonas sp. FP597 TaxID=2954096 RepID=UPI00273510B6|nr:SidA/IucD/PvdA family monooxygenase [Pseudomonas sp. FP597]WLI07439.1 SidA/IucD/PvdA family monooxygenase [Pseudomonas sp. FP597]